MTARDLEYQIQDEGIESMNRFYSVYRSICADNRDPLNLGRLKILCPPVWGGVIPDVWFRPFGLITGEGVFCGQLPSIGDAIYVMFEDGNPETPIWSYGWWAEGEFPKELENRYDKLFLIRSKSGNTLLMDDESGDVVVLSKNGGKVSINENIAVVAKSGETINVSDGKIELSSNVVTLSGESSSAVLGDVLKEMMQTMVLAMSKPTIPNVPILTPDDILELNAKLIKLLSEKVKLS